MKSPALFSLAAILALSPQAFAVDAEGVTENKTATHALKPYDRKPDTAPQDSVPSAARSFAKARIPAGFKADLWASEPLLANPVAFSFDGKGRMFIAETHRYRTSVLDIRHYMFMLEDDLANRNQDDWAKSIKKNFPNDWQELGKESEVVRLVEDSDGDGKADKSRVYADGFNSILDGIASGVLARPDGVWLTNIPGLYKLSGEGADGKAEKKEEVFRGFGVRFNYTGHDLHGLIKGPDGRLYFSIGDRGASVKTKEGKTIEVPDEGAIFRCEEDGSRLELVMRGLRNPQELAFDDYGNLFTCDNDSDQGDRERLVYVVEGGDAGWRVGYQHCPQPAERNPWLAEHMWEPRDPAKNQPASILSPVANLPDGPGGFVHYPGTGLPEKYNGCFFLACYKGTSATSQVAVLKPVPEGAGFKLEMLETFIPGCQATDVDFGPDSRLYVSFWDEGWERTAQGRIMKVEHEEARKAQAAQIAEVQKLLSEGMKQRSTEELVKLLGHKDQRVRLEAQWEVERGMQVNGPRWKILLKALEEKDHTVQRHALWALTNTTRRVMSAQYDSEYAKPADAPTETKEERGWRRVRAALLPDYRNLPDELATTIASLKVCDDDEMYAHVLRCLGDIMVTWGPSDECGHLIYDGLSHSSARVRFFAAQALRRKSDADNLVFALRRLIEDSHLSQELQLAAAKAVAQMGWSRETKLGMNGGVTRTVFEECAEDSNPPVRMVALRAAFYALEQPKSSEVQTPDRKRVLACIAAMLRDSDPAIAREALWLVSDRGLEAALSAAGHAVFDQEPEEGGGLKLLRPADTVHEVEDGMSVLRRFNAYFRTGGAVNAERLVSELNDEEARPSLELCVEALKMLSEWEKPPARDRVNGLFRPLAKRSGEGAALALRGLSEELLESHSAITLQMLETVRVIKAASWADYCAALVLRDEIEPSVRVKSLHVLSELRGTVELADTLKKAATDPSSTVRIAAAGLLGKTDPAAAVKALETVLAEGKPEEVRPVLEAVATIQSTAADALVASQVQALTAGKVPAGAKLELLEIARQRQSPAVMAALQAYEAAQPKDDPLARFDAVLEGGNAENGKKLFKEHAVAACQRCHMVNKSGGEAGPALDGIGSKRDRRYLLESIVLPSAQFADGFRMAVCTMKDGSIKAGAIKAETADILTLQNLNEDPVTLKKADIAQQDQAPSGMMPGLGDLLTPRELRDLIEYCASLK